MKSKKSYLGVLIVLASLAGGALLIFWNPFAQPPKPQSPAAAKTTALKVSIKPSGADGLALVTNIKCPQNKERCPSLERLTVADLSVKQGLVCSAIYGGPSVADVEGTLKGAKVKLQLTVTDGCRIELWNKLVKPLGLPPSETSLKS